MKPSEYLEEKDCIAFRDDDTREIYSLSDNDEDDMTDENMLQELDKRFIDREELKDKINKIFDNHSCYFSDKFDEFEFNNIKRKVLELIK